MSAIIHIKETDSTNNYLKELLIKQNVEEGTVVWSDFQLAGKGQRGNGWESENQKNLLFSIVFYPDTISAEKQFILSQIVSLAVADCLKSYVENITIKWPNDIYWQEKKICGILLENTIIEDRIGQSVAGIGININQEQFWSNVPNPVSLKQITGNEYDIKNILGEIIETIGNYYQLIRDGNVQFVMDRYKESLFRKEGYHLYNDGQSEFLARIDDIESSGLLVLKTKDNKIKRFTFKEIKYIL